MMSNSDSNKQKPNNQLRNLVIACILVAGGVAALISIIYFSTFTGELGNHERFGQFGDYIGGILNPVVAFCALMALMFGIKQQRKELKETRDQFSEQSFDSMFFQMLQLHNDMVSSIESDIVLTVGYDFYSYGEEAEPEKKGKLGRGRESFHVMYKSINQEHWNKKNDSISQEYLDGIYMPTYQQCQSVLGHYFRYLYNIFQFIDSADIKEQKKLFYGKLVRAQLSNHELAVLYYNCLSKLGSEKFKPLVEKYSLFKNLPFDLLLRADHFSLYESQAWGSNFEDVKAAGEAAIATEEAGFTRVP